MPARFSDALRGYAHDVLKRDGFRCRYCGLDGTLWPNWLYRSWDHLLPKGHPQRDSPDFIVAACRFCYEAGNRTVFDVDGKTPDQLVDQKRLVVLGVSSLYQQFWEQEVGSFATNVKDQANPAAGAAAPPSQQETDD